MELASNSLPLNPYLIQEERDEPEGYLFSLSLLSVILGSREVSSCYNDVSEAGVLPS